MVTIHNNIIHGTGKLEGQFNISYSEQLYRQLKSGGDQIAQIHNVSGKNRTYMEILQKCATLAESLRGLGVKKGDVVGISCENRFEFTECAIAIMFVGAINATFNTLYTIDELKHTLNVSKPKFVFASKSSINRIIETTKTIPSVKTVIAIDEPESAMKDDVVLYSNLMKKKADLNKFRITEVDVNDPIAILCSSGTTGLPKGVLLTHHNFSVSTSHVKKLVYQNEPIRTQCLLSLIPWFHAYGFITHLIALNIHLKYVFMMKFEDVPFLSAIQNYKVTLMFLVPPLVLFLAKSPLVSKYDLSSLKEIWCGAAPLSDKLAIEVKKRIGVKRIFQGYGLTEATLAVTHSGVNSTLKYGSCGKCLPGLMIKIVDPESGEVLGAYKEGELCVKGPTRMVGYIGDSASTNKMFDSDDWLHTGDIAYYDAQRNFYIVDRLKELIKYKCFQVAPAELEAILLQHPGIVDCGVIGKPDEEAGELPVAFAVRRPGVDVSSEEIIQFVAGKVSIHKRLHGGVIFVDEIPKNPSGKILRKQLRANLKEKPKSKL